MPTNPHYESVRAKVIAACPELMELSFGCYIKSKYHSASERIIEDFSDSLIQCENGVVERNEIDIIGHPIRLSHIFRVWQERCKKIQDISFKNLGECIAKFSKVEAGIAAIMSHWNLEKDSLENQSPETWEALDKMLSV